jgi:parvulin-like peptidyl-prolyl isomerase
MKKSILAIALSASLVLTGVSAASAANPSIAGCTQSAVVAKKTADASAKNVHLAEKSVATTKVARKAANDKLNAALKTNKVNLHNAIKACRATLKNK